MNWKPYAQLIRSESQGITPFCSSYAACNAYEIMAKQRGTDINLSDRYLAVISETPRTGQTIPRVLTEFQGHGVVDESKCTFPWWWNLFSKYQWAWNAIFDISKVDPTAPRHKIKYSYRVDCLPYTKIKSLYDIQQGLEQSPLLLLIPSPYNQGAYHTVVGLFIFEEFIEVYDSVFSTFWNVHTSSIIEAYCMVW